MKIKLSVMLGSLMLAGTGAASAQALQDTPDTARDIVAQRLGQDLTTKQVAMLNLVAHATAAAITCPKIDMNEDAVKGALTIVINERLPDLKSDAERAAFRDRTLVGFGALVGLSIDEAAPKKAEFCKIAEQEMTEEGTASFIKPHVMPPAKK